MEQLVVVLRAEWESRGRGGLNGTDGGDRGRRREAVQAGFNWLNSGPGGGGGIFAHVGTFLDRFHDGADKAFGWNGLQVEVSDQFVRVRTIEIRATAAEFVDPFNGSREAHQEVSGLEDLFHPFRGLRDGLHGNRPGEREMQLEQDAT